MSLSRAQAVLQNIEIPCVQRQTAPFAGVIGVMKCEVTPPLAVVVPEVVAGVLPVNPDRQF